jgi:hypothetical protein
MERLTNKREADAQRKEYERRLANGYPRNIPEERFLRLAAYEDTHMMPSDVTSMRMDMAIIAALFNSIDVDRMKELAEADRAGRLVVRPCNVGDTLFRVFAGEILEHKVSNMRYLAIQGRWDIDTTPFCSYVESSIGKTIFLTHEQAEKALEAMKDE